MSSREPCSDTDVLFEDDDNGPGDWICQRCGVSVRSEKWTNQGGRQQPPFPAGFPHQPFRTATGRVLTDDDFEKLADEAERGYDVGNLTPRGER